MNKSENFKAAHKATKLEIRTRKRNMYTYKMTYSELFSMFLKKQYGEVTKTVTVSISYENKKTRKIIKNNGGTWNPTTKTWTVTIAKKNLHLVEKYIVSNTATVAPSAKKTTWLVNEKEVKNNLSYNDMYNRYGMDFE